MESQRISKSNQSAKLASSQQAGSDKAKADERQYFNPASLTTSITQDQADGRDYFNQNSVKLEGAPQPANPDEITYFNDLTKEQQQTSLGGPTYLNNMSSQQLSGFPGYKDRNQYQADTRPYFLENQASAPNTSNSNQASAASQVAQIQQPRQRELTEVLSFKGTDGQEYNVFPVLTQQQATYVEVQSGVLLKKDPQNSNQYSGFLGGGFFGRVYIAKQISTNNYVAVKIIQGADWALTESAHESTLQRKLTRAIKREDSQLMPMDDAVRVEENGNLVALYTVLPLAALGSTEDLHKELNNFDNVTGSLGRLLTLHLAKGVLIGLYQMHKNHIYHLDIKTANILINDSGTIQIGDFGTSEEVIGNPPSVIHEQSASGRIVGNGDRSYFAPDRPRDPSTHQSFNPAKSDLYAVGALLWEFITGDKFKGNHNNQALNHQLLQNPAANSIAHLAKLLLSDNPNHRPSVEEALNHPSLCQGEVHDREMMSTVLDFLKRFVRYNQLKARRELSEAQVSANLQAELRQSQASRANLSNDRLELNPLLKTPFKDRADIEEQLAMYLPLSASFKRKVEDPQKDSFDLMRKTDEFLADPNQVLLLLLADGGSGKSLFMQYLTTTLLQTQKLAPNGKPYLPLYIILSNIKTPDRLFEEGLNLTPESIHKLQETHQLVILADGFDEQTTWANLYVQNQLQRYDSMQGNTRHSIKLIITCRINALPPSYGEYFTPRVPGELAPRSMQEVYIQPFQANQIDTYVANYINQHKETIKEQVEQKQLPLQWLDPKYVQEQIKNISGLKELMQTPLLSRLVLIALPELNKQHNQAQTTLRKITRAQVYEAFMRQWIITQIRKNDATNPNTKQPKEIAVTDDKINEILSFGEKMALTMYRDNRSAQLTVGLQTFSFNLSTGKYDLNPTKYGWFEQGRVEQTLLPLQEVQKGAYKFVHLSIQEYLLARHLINELTQSNTLVNLMLNQLTLTIEEKDRQILYFMGDLATISKVVADKLFALINQTKTIKSQGIAGANAISVLNVSEVPLAHHDFSNTYLPNSDLSGSILWNTAFSNANLPNMNLQGSKLNNSNFAKANVPGLRLGQYPMYSLKESIAALCYSPDGSYLAISQKKELILFDIVTRKEIRSFKGHTKLITSVSFSGDSKRLATGSLDKTVRIYDTQSGDCLKVLKGHTDYVRSVSFSGDGKRLAMRGEDKTARIYDTQSGDCLRVLVGHNSDIKSLSFSGDGKRLATGSWDNTARIYDAESGECLKVLEGHTGSISSVSFSGDGKRLATGGWDNTARIYDVASGKFAKLLVGHTNSIECISFSADGKRVATGSLDNTVRIYDAVSGECTKVLLVGHTGSINSVSFSGDGKRLAMGGYRTVQLYDAESGDCLKVLDGHTKVILSVSFSGDGKRVATASYGNIARIYAADTGECLKVLVGHDSINSISFSGDGKRLVTAGGKIARIYDAVSGDCLKVLEGHTREIKNVSFSRDGKLVATGSKDNTARIYDAESGKCLNVLKGHTKQITSVSFSADGKRVATGSEDKTARIYDAVSGECLKVLEDVRSVSFSVDGAILLTQDYNYYKKMWSVSNGEELKFDNTFAAWSESSTRSLDNVSVYYYNTTVNLKQNILLSRVSESKAEKLSLSFPSKVKDVSLSKSIIGNEIIILTVVFETGMVFYSKALESPLSDFTPIKVSMIDQILDGSGMDLSNTEGLSESNYEVLQQLGAAGEIARLAASDQISMPELQAKDSQ